MPEKYSPILEISIKKFNIPFFPINTYSNFFELFYSFLEMFTITNSIVSPTRFSKKNSLSGFYIPFRHKLFNFFFHKVQFFVCKIYVGEL